MTTIRDDLRTVEGFPRGVNNVARAREVPAGALRVAENVDLSGEGKPRRRQGYTKMLSGTRVQSLFGHPHLPFMVARVDDTLVAIDGDRRRLQVAAVLAEGLGTGPATYAVFNGELLWSVAGVASGVVDAHYQSRPLGVPTPPKAACAAGSGGGLLAGTYLVALSYMLDSGEDGGLGEATAVTVDDNGAITVDLPEPPADVGYIRVWRSECNGTTLAHAVDEIAGVAEARLEEGDLGKDTDTQFLQPLPPGHILRTLNAQAWMAVGRELRIGRAMRPFLHHPGHDRVPYRDRIDMLEPVGEGGSAGLFVAAGKRVFFLAADRTSALNQRIAHAHGAIPGTSLVVPVKAFGLDGDSMGVYWVDTRGVACLGLPGGNVMALTKDTVAMHRFERGASLLREVDGLRSVVTAGRGGTASPFGTTDSVEFVHYRNGIPVP